MSSLKSNSIHLSQVVSQTLNNDWHMKQEALAWVFVIRTSAGETEALKHWLHKLSLELIAHACRGGQLTDNLICS